MRDEDPAGVCRRLAALRVRRERLRPLALDREERLGGRGHAQVAELVRVVGGCGYVREPDLVAVERIEIAAAVRVQLVERVREQRVEVVAVARHPVDLGLAVLVRVDLRGLHAVRQRVRQEVARPRVLLPGAVGVRERPTGLIPDRLPVGVLAVEIALLRRHQERRPRHERVVLRLEMDRAGDAGVLREVQGVGRAGTVEARVPIAHSGHEVPVVERRVQLVRRRRRDEYRRRAGGLVTPVDVGLVAIGQVADPTEPARERLVDRERQLCRRHRCVVRVDLAVGQVRVLREVRVERTRDGLEGASAVPGDDVQVRAVQIACDA